MLGPKITTVFRSRWNALFWSAGVLLTAYCSVPARDETAPATSPAATGPAKSDPTGEPAPTHAHVNPWAKEPAPR